MEEKISLEHVAPFWRLDRAGNWLTVSKGPPKPGSWRLGTSRSISTEKQQGVWDNTNVRHSEFDVLAWTKLSQRPLDYEFRLRHFSSILLDFRLPLTMRWRGSETKSGSLERFLWETPWFSPKFVFRQSQFSPVISQGREHASKKATQKSRKREPKEKWVALAIS